MKVKYLSYKRAVSVFFRYKNLVGRPFSKSDEHSGTIKFVLLSPYNKILQWQFLTMVFGGTSPQKALDICRDGKYDVIIVSDKYNPNEKDFRPKPIRNYLSEFESNPEE